MQFEQIPIVYIKPDPNQPRKFFDETAQQELTNSIIEKEVIQPIIVRGESPNYMLVCGERRLRSATIVMEMFPIRNTIPAVIRQMSDEEALELQIIENLQRKDVHPMEEAVAFESMLQHGMDAKEIAAKVGKSDFFIRQRIKLCALTDNWQKAFFANRLSISEALKIVLFADDVQEKLFSTFPPDREIKINDGLLIQYSGNLTNAPFDTTDTTLGNIACTSCIFNSGVARLFQDEVTAFCSDKICYSRKCENNFTKAIEEAIQDPAMIFVQDNWKVQKDDTTERLESAGFVVYGTNDYEQYDEPDKPVFEEWKEEEYFDDETTDEDIKIQFTEAFTNYEVELAALREDLKMGTYKKAFKLTGIDRGRYLMVKLYSVKTASPSSGAGGPKDPDAIAKAEITAEIERLTTKEKRSKELDESKVWENIRRHFNPHANASLLKGAFVTLENDAAAMAMYEKLNYSNRDAFNKLFKGKSGVFNGTTDEELRQMTRFFFLDVLPPSALQYGVTHQYKICMELAAGYFPGLLAEAKADQQKLADKRIARVDEKIAALKQQLKNLTPKKEKHAAAKKTAKNQAAEPQPEAKEQTPVVSMVPPSEDSTIKKAIKNLIGKNKGIKQLLHEKIS